MDKESAQKRIQELSAEIEKHNYNYYVLSHPTISDYDFDMMLEEMIRLEKQYPEFLSANSPSQRVGGAITKEFKTVKHQYPMLSLANSYSQEEIMDFDQRVKKGLNIESTSLFGADVEYVCELKFDGLSISLIYENGLLKQAVTRGDGLQGDDVTNNAKTIKSIPLQLRGDFPEHVEVRGEIFMPHKIFEEINTEREEIGEQPFANPRNAASGTMKMQDSSVVAKRKLDCYMYYVLGEKIKFETHAENLQKAKSWGFKISSYSKVCEGIDGVITFIDHWDKKRKDLPFDIDGIVIKLNNVKHQEQLGFTAKSPRWAIAYKYKAEQVSTLLESISYQVGRKAMNIDSLGAETIDQLYKVGLLNNIADIYDLKKEQLLPLERMAEKSVNNLIDGIKQSTQVPFERVLYAIGIRHVGETTAKKIARKVKSIETLEKATKEELLEIEEVGEIIADSILNFFSNDENKKIIAHLKNKGLQFKLSEEQLQASSDKLKGLTFVISGVFTIHSRDELKNLIEQNGGKNSGSISGKTSYLLAGDNMGPEKLKKAESLKIKIISENDFLTMLD